MLPQWERFLSSGLLERIVARFGQGLVGVQSLPEGLPAGCQFRHLDRSQQGMGAGPAPVPGGMGKVAARVSEALGPTRWAAQYQAASAPQDVVLTLPEQRHARPGKTWPLVLAATGVK
jgi:hypothetical protein